MRQGDFAAAWEVSDAALLRPRDPSAPRHLQRVWNGDPLEGKRVLVRCYHGLGDTVQFARYLPRLKAIAAEVIVWVQPALIPLLGGVDRLLPLHDGAPGVEYDAEVEIMELAHVFRTVPGDVPYLHAPPLPAPPSEGLKVGLVWRAGDWDERRSIPLRFLTSLPDVSLYALQRGAGLAEWREEFGPNVGSDLAEETAGVMQSLDLIISIDSFPAHLAGALGRPTWTLLHSDADWRWMNDREDSPWYPTMRLFRQKRPGDWDSVIAQLTRKLTSFHSAGSSARKTRRPL